MDAKELDTMLEAAAERGARRALETLGLHDEHAGKDIRDLRTLIDGWRQAKTTMFKTFTQWVTFGVLGALVVGAWSQLGAKK